MRKIGPSHGRTGKPGPVDAHIGARVRARRRLLGMRQESLGKVLGVSFQMVQQYERGAVRISAAQLYDMASALDVPVGFFFDDMPAAIAASKTAQGDSRAEEASNFELDPQVKRETLQLVRAYYNISDRQVREQLFAMVNALSAASSGRTKP